MPLSEQRGFTLIECVVAAAVLLIGWTAVTGTLMASVRAVALEQGLSRGELLVTDRCECLRSLPFAVDRVPAGQDVPQNIVDEVFPWAMTQRNRDDEFYSSQARAGHPPATFFTTDRVGGVELETAATFVSSTRSGWQPIGPGLVEGFQSDVGDEPPAEAIIVVVSASWSCQGRPHEFVQTVVLADRQASTATFDDPADSIPGASL